MTRPIQIPLRLVLIPRPSLSRAGTTLSLTSPNTPSPYLTALSGGNTVVTYRFPQSPVPLSTVTFKVGRATRGGSESLVGRARQ